MEVCSMTQGGTQPGVCNNLEGGKGRRREGDSRRSGRVYTYIWFTDVWQKLTQFCTATSFQFKKNLKEKEKISSRKNVQYKLTLRSESKWHN